MSENTKHYTEHTEKQVLTLVDQIKSDVKLLLKTMNTARSNGFQEEYK